MHISVWLKPCNKVVRSAVLVLAGLIATSNLSPLHAEDPPILNAGDAVVTGFSGVVDPQIPDPLPATFNALDETLINLDGISARINPLAAPGYVWDARVWPADLVREFKAREIGQVFGVTLDAEKQPNIYVTATSAYGLHIVAPDADNDGRPERLKKGSKDASWMEGMWGTTDAKDPAGSVGGPGSIWKIDGITAEVSLFANITLNGAANSGAGLGNITYVKDFNQIFVSDLSTGMIHRLNMDGTEVEIFDHGVTGRISANLPAVAYDAAGTLDITKKDFDSEDPDTWGLTDEDRRVYALAFHDGRLFYSVTGGSQIWSVGFDKDTGKFLSAAQWEIDVPKKPKNLPVTDIVFTHKGAMILAQRGEISSIYDYANFANTGKSRTYRYWLESPKDDPATPSRWIAEPQEYAVGFDDNNRATDGGLALNYGYTKEGYIDPSQCEATLWTTGDNLRHTEDAELIKALTPGGPLVIDGLQGVPAGPVNQDPPTKNNQPPWASYMVDLEPLNTEQFFANGEPTKWNDNVTLGWMGDLAIYHPCSGGAGGVGNYYGGAGYPWSYPSFTQTGDGSGGGSSGNGTGGGSCTPGVDCPVDQSCIIPRGDFVCDEKTGTWSFQLGASLIPGLKADSIKITSTSPGISITNGAVITMGNPATPLNIGGTLNGQLINIGLCLFDKAASDSGKPFDCCKTTITVQAPSKICVKK
jgi:hypothetical protein